MKLKSKISLLVLIITMICFSGCGSSEEIIKKEDPINNSTSVGNADLESLYANTFKSNNLDIDVDPHTILLNDVASSIEMNDTVTTTFRLNNNSNQTLTFKIANHSLGGGLMIKDSVNNPVQYYSEYSIGKGESLNFTVNFTAFQMGTQTSILTITTTEEAGYIKFPIRAVVGGSASFKIISAGYLCSDTSAPEITSVDFYKVVGGLSKSQTLKICNTGGASFSVKSVSINQLTSNLHSEVMTDSESQNFAFTFRDQIDADLSNALSILTSPLTAEALEDYPETIANPESFYSVNAYNDDDSIQNLLIAPGEMLTFNIVFEPLLNAEAPVGTRYNPVSLRGILDISTSLGDTSVALLGASSGIEPTLAVYTKSPDINEWTEVDTSARQPAISFGDVSLFRDWIATNYNEKSIRFVNEGDGSKDLVINFDAPTGFYEFVATNSGESLQMPLRLSSGDSKTYTLRYLPAPSSTLDDNFVANYDFGLLTLSHSGGNGPQNHILLVGNQTAGYSTELYLGGSKIKRSYGETEYKNFCTFSTQSTAPTQKTFRVENHNPNDSMTVRWSVSNSRKYTATPSSGTLTVPALSSEVFTIDFLGSARAIGTQVTGTLTVDTEFTTTESQARTASYPLETRSFELPFQATVSDSQGSALCTGEVVGDVSTDDEDTSEVTLIVHGITMGMPSLPEPTRGYPPFRFFWKLKIDKENRRVLVPERTAPIYERDDPNYDRLSQLLTPLHQGVSNNPCPTLPGNPYAHEYERGSWTGPGYDTCVINYTDPTNGEQKTFYADTTCREDNMADTYTDADGVTWNVMYHEFFKFDPDTCELEYHGKFATFAWDPAVQTELDLLGVAEAHPNESEAYYQSLFQVFKFDSYIQLESESFSSICDNQTYITDPDGVKECYEKLTALSSAKRVYGHVDECAHFYYIFEKGEVPEDAFAENPNTDNWVGYGIYEPYVDANGVESQTKYDITIYNLRMHAFMIKGGDRSSFFGHPSHTLHTQIDITLTTKRVAEESWRDGDWQQRIAVSTRPHIDKNFIFMKDGDPFNIQDYWTNDGKNSEFTNSLNPDNLERGIDYGGYGKGTFRYVSGTDDEIILAGWPFNFDENNLGVITGIGRFAGLNNTSPSWAIVDAATGKGKAMSFSLYGCLYPGTPESNQGCFDYKRDDGLMPDGRTLVIDEYVDAGMLPSGYPESSECSKLSDPGFKDTEEYLSDPNKYLSCINYIIHDVDRDRYKNYYDLDNKFIFDDDPYGQSVCGYGM